MERLEISPAPRVSVKACRKVDRAECWAGGQENVSHGGRRQRSRRRSVRVEPLEPDRPGWRAFQDGDDLLRLGDSPCARPSGGRDGLQSGGNRAAGAGSSFLGARRFRTHLSKASGTWTTRGERLGRTRWPNCGKMFGSAETHEDGFTCAILALSTWPLDCQRSVGQARHNEIRGGMFQPPGLLLGRARQVSSVCTKPGTELAFGEEN